MLLFMFNKITRIVVEDKQWRCRGIWDRQAVMLSRHLRQTDTFERGATAPVGQEVHRQRMANTKITMLSVVHGHEHRLLYLQWLRSAVNNNIARFHRLIHGEPTKGMSEQNRNSKIVNRNENKQGPDWCLVQTCSPSFFRFRKNTRSTAYCQN